MRGGLIIVGIIFWVSVRFEFPEQMVRGGECEVSQSGRYLNGDYTTVFAGLLNRGEHEKSTFAIQKQKPFYYFATETDTLRLNGFNDESFESLNKIDFDLIFSSLDIYDVSSLTYLFSFKWEPDQRFLVEIHEADLDYLGAGQILEAQLDNDPETERIVRLQGEWTYIYLFYDSYGSYWRHAGAVSVIDNSNNNEPDFSLSGFIGLEQWSHGTFQSAIDKSYYTLVYGHIQKAFEINSSAYLGMLFYSNSLYVGVTSETELMYVNASETFVEHNIRLYTYHSQSDTVTKVLKEETVSYSLVEKDAGKFLPDKSIPGFNYHDNPDSTYFFPEAYAYEELKKMKESGNAKQKELLRDFVYDSTATFR